MISKPHNKRVGTFSAIKIAVAIHLSINPARAKVFTNEEFGKKKQLNTDSLKAGEYTHSLLIWGKKVIVNTVRPDIWLIPLIHVYEIFGAATVETHVNFGDWMPNGKVEENEALSTSTIAEYQIATNFGLGKGPATGITGMQYTFAY